jgi:hypothetical protein
MKYLIPLILIILAAGTVYGTYLFLPEEFEECCSYLGLLAPEGVSEVPGVAHADLPDATDDGSIPADLPGLKLGDAAGEIALPDLDGKAVNIDFSKADLTAIVWVSCYCPTSMIYEARLNQVAADYSGVQWYAINSSAMESVEELRKHYGDGDPDRLRLTVLKDDRNVIADRFGVSVTTETYIFNRAGKLEYRGGIDDARNPQRVEVHYVRPVLDALANGREPKWRYQPAKGCCPIDRIKPDQP